MGSLFGKKKEKCPVCKREFNDHEEFIEHITTIHPEERPCPDCKGTMRWVDLTTENHPYDTPEFACDNCGYTKYYLAWDEWNGGYGKKKINFYPKREKNKFKKS